MGINVLAVDDDPTTLKVVAQIIKRANDQKLTETAKDGSEGFTKWQAAFDEGKPYAVVFTDKDMPNKNGLELIKNIRDYEKQKDVKEDQRVLIAMNSTDNVAENAVEAGANEFILKATSLAYSKAVTAIFENFKTTLAARELPAQEARQEKEDSPARLKRQASDLEKEEKRARKNPITETPQDDIVSTKAFEILAIGGKQIEILPEIISELPSSSASLNEKNNPIGRDKSDTDIGVELTTAYHEHTGGNHLGSSNLSKLIEEFKIKISNDGELNLTAKDFLIEKYPHSAKASKAETTESTSPPSPEMHKSKRFKR